MIPSSQPGEPTERLRTLIHAALDDAQDYGEYRYASALTAKQYREAAVESQSVLWTEFQKWLGEVASLRQQNAELRAALGAPSSPPPPAGNPGCADCGLPYASDRWVEAVLTDDVWRTISPDGEGNGLLCIGCIAARLTRQGSEKVPVMLAGVEPLRLAKDRAEMTTLGVAVGRMFDRNAVLRIMELERENARLSAS